MACHDPWMNVRSAPSWQGDTIPITTLCSMVVGANPSRRSVIIIVSGSNAVVLTPGQATTGGVTIPAGGSLTLDTSGAIWARCPGGSSEVSTVAIFGEV